MIFKVEFNGDHVYVEAESISQAREKMSNRMIITETDFRNSADIPDGWGLFS